MSALNLRILDETDTSVSEVTGRYCDNHALDVLKRYLEPGGDLSLDQATAMIDEMLPDPTNPDEKHLHGQAEYFYNLILEQGQQIPYSHPAQLRFVRLLKRLQISCKFNETQTWPLGEEKTYRVHANMQKFHWSIREQFPYGFYPDDEDGLPFYANLNAFLARLSVYGIHNGVSWAIWTLRDNLEEEKNEVCYSEIISASSMWVLCAGQWLFNEVMYPQKWDEQEERIYRNGPLYTGPVFGLERWKFWQKAFAAAAESQYANEECKKLALKAVDLMGAIMKDVMW